MLCFDANKPPYRRTSVKWAWLPGLTYPVARRAAWGLSTGAERSWICRHSAFCRARAGTTGQYIPEYSKQTLRERERTAYTSLGWSKQSLMHREGRMQQIRKDEVPGKRARLCSDTVSATASKGEQGERLHNSGFLNSGCSDTSKGRTVPSLHVSKGRTAPSLHVNKQREYTSKPSRQQRENSSEPSRQQTKAVHLQAFTSTKEEQLRAFTSTKGEQLQVFTSTNKWRIAPSLHVNKGRIAPSLHVNKRRENSSKPSRQQTNKGRTAPQLGVLNIGYLN